MTNRFSSVGAYKRLPKPGIEAVQLGKVNPEARKSGRGEYGQFLHRYRVCPRFDIGNFPGIPSDN
jgi:hypothetical protein